MGRVVYDVELRLKAAGLYDAGLGRTSIANSLGIPEEAVRKWLDTYRSMGTEGLAAMGKRYATYSYETKLAAARVVVEEGVSKPEAMARFGIALMTPLKSWIKAYREGGEEALRPKRKGRPSGSARPRSEATREQELERQVRRLEAEVAYLKKLSNSQPNGVVVERKCHPLTCCGIRFSQD